MLAAEIAPLCFVEKSNLISTLCGHIKNPLCNFVTPCPYIMRNLEMLKHRGQTGLGTKTLTSASVSAS